MQAKINNRGDVVGTPTPKQEELLSGVLFQLEIGLYKQAVASGQRTAPIRLVEINRQMDEAVKTELAPAYDSCKPVGCM